MGWRWGAFLDTARPPRSTLWAHMPVLVPHQVFGRKWRQRQIRHDSRVPASGESKHERKDVLEYRLCSDALEHSSERRGRCVCVVGWGVQPCGTGSCQAVREPENQAGGLNSQPPRERSGSNENLKFSTQGSMERMNLTKAKDPWGGPMCQGVGPVKGQRVRKWSQQLPHSREAKAVVFLCKTCGWWPGKEHSLRKREGPESWQRECWAWGGRPFSLAMQPGSQSASAPHSKPWPVPKCFC